ncbi:hypothetical protein [Streptomyces turgidiscabies]|uniref:hypothetical protein n=1 Tax=Streptomyces turgidiscabies TaxID=85558 RepID=UPI0038F65B5F
MESQEDQPVDGAERESKVPGLMEPRRRTFQVFTVNQVVAYNLMRFRRASGWTQEECAAELTRVTGKPWTNASLSAAERSWKTGRIKEFDANEIMAFASVFRKGVMNFFIPIPGAEAIANRYVHRRPREGDPVYSEDLAEIPQEPGEGWMTSLDMLQFVLARWEMGQTLTEDVNKVLERYGLIWEGVGDRYTYRDPETERDQALYSAPEREQRIHEIGDELIFPGEWRDPDPLRASVNIDFESLRGIIEEAAEAAVLEFLRGLKRENRNVGRDDTGETEDSPFEEEDS